jgi:hypothetical protein
MGLHFGKVGLKNIANWTGFEDDCGRKAKATSDPEIAKHPQRKGK